MIYCSHRPWAYVELHPKIHLAASPEYGDTTCVGLFGSLAAYGAPKTKHRLQDFKGHKFLISHLTTYHSFEGHKMPRWHKTPTNDPILESRYPKLFAERHVESMEYFIFWHKLRERDIFFFLHKVVTKWYIAQTCHGNMWNYTPKYILLLLLSMGIPHVWDFFGA